MALPIVRWAGSKFFDEGSVLLGKDSIVPGGISPATQSPVGVPTSARTLRWNLQGQSPMINDLIRSDPAEFRGARRINPRGPQYEKAKYLGSMYQSLRDPDLRDAPEIKDLLNDFVAENMQAQLYAEAPTSNPSTQRYKGIG